MTPDAQATCATCRHTMGINAHDYRHLCMHPAMVEANHGSLAMLPVYYTAVFDGPRVLMTCSLHEPSEHPDRQPAKEPTR